MTLTEDEALQFIDDIGVGIYNIEVGPERMCGNVESYQEYVKILYAPAFVDVN